MMFKKVLVIDDSETDRLYAEIILERSGAAASVLGFESALDALGFLATPEAGAIDAILLDINMPGIDGFGFLERYEAALGGGEARAVVMMLSSSSDPEERKRASAFSSVFGFIVKPISTGAAAGLHDLVAQARQPRA